MTTVEACVRSLRRAANELGESPTKAQYETLGYTPASGTIIRTVGSWNEAKRRAGLETVEAGEIGGPDVAPKPDDVELGDDETWTELSPHQRWYRKNRERQQGKKRRRRSELRRWLVAYKHESCTCERCGEDHAACLDFHHPPDVEKRDSITRMVQRGFARSAIRDEIRKCVVLCANCHRKEHFVPPETD